MPNPATHTVSICRPTVLSCEVMCTFGGQIALVSITIQNIIYGSESLNPIKTLKIYFPGCHFLYSKDYITLPYDFLEF